MCKAYRKLFILFLPIGCVYSHIMACVDGSYDSEVAAKYAYALAHASSAAISVLTVRGSPLHDPESSLERLRRIAIRHGLSVEFIEAEGDRHEVVLSTAKKRGVDAIVVSSGGKVKRFGRFSNNLATHLVTSADTTVFVVKSVRATTGLGHRKMLFPIQSVSSFRPERAGVMALLYKMYNRPLSLIRCKKISQDTIYSDQEAYEAHNAMQEYLQPLRENLYENDVPHFVYTRICHSIREEVLRFIEQNNYDLLFLRITPGRFGSFVRKDFAIEVMKSSECNVILWKPKGA